MSKLSPRWWRVLFPGVVAFGMAIFMSGVITALNTGLAGAFLARWARAFVIAFPLAWAAAFLWAPIAQKITATFVTPPGP